MEVKAYAWNEEKNEKLKAERGISFEEVVLNIANGNILYLVAHPNQEKYQGQKIFIVAVRNYAYLVPFVENDDEIFLKTIIPNGKANQKYLGGQRDQTDNE